MSLTQRQRELDKVWICVLRTAATAVSMCQAGSGSVYMGCMIFQVLAVNFAYDSYCNAMLMNTTNYKKWVIVYGTLQPKPQLSLSDPILRNDPKICNFCYFWFGKFF